MKKTLLIFLVLLGILTGLYSVPRELVVVEIGTGTWCGYCPGAAMGAHDLLSNGHAVAIVKNHNGDAYANTFSNARNTYYGVPGYPTAYFDGLNSVVSGSSSSSMYGSYLPRVTARLAVPSHYTLSASGFNNGNNYVVIANIAKPEDDTNSNVVLHASLTQSNIPVVWGNQTDVDNVNRIMMPNQNGTPVNLNTGDQTSVALSFTTQTTWPLQDLELVLWLQNTVTKEILQGKKYALSALPQASSVQTDYFMFPYISVNTSSTKQIVLANTGSNPVTGSIAIDNSVFTSNVTNFTIAPMSIQLVNVVFTPTQALAYEGIMTINGNFPDAQEFSVILNGMAFTNTAPNASAVTHTGLPVQHQIHSGAYTYSDPENHAEGASLKKWYRIVNEVPTLIPAANALTYAITAEDVGYQIAFEITPVDIHGFTGTPVMSAPSAVIIAPPAPQNFNAVLELPNNVVCTWQRPQYFESRWLVGYALYRNDLNIANITDPNTLTFTDTFLDDGTYEYKICSRFSNPNHLSETTAIVTVIVGEVANEDLVAIPQTSISVHPNPFSTDVNFSISLKAVQPSNLIIYNVKGQTIRTFTVIPDSKGKTTVNWDGRTNDGLLAKNGVYFYRVDNGTERVSGKLMLLK